MRAANGHHNAGERLSVADALLMYTYDAARFGHVETETGRSQRATRPISSCSKAIRSSAKLRRACRCAETWCDGVRVAG